MNDGEPSFEIHRILFFMKVQLIFLLKLTSFTAASLLFMSCGTNKDVAKNESASKPHTSGQVTGKKDYSDQDEKRTTNTAEQIQGPK